MSLPPHFVLIVCQRGNTQKDQVAVPADKARALRVSIATARLTKPMTPDLLSLPL
jgi:hypothetical protein